MSQKNLQEETSLKALMDTIQSKHVDEPTPATVIVQTDIQVEAPPPHTQELKAVAEEVESKTETTDDPLKEVSPHGRYVKLDERLGSGAYKDVWRAYDTIEGMEVAWNIVKLSRIPPSERKRIKTEVKLLRDIEHKNVIKYYSSWVDREKEQIVFITEIMSAGSLKEYLRKNPMIRWNAVKRWCRQILRGLEFLHSKQIIHRDIKCDNIFINGSTGDLRIGDLGLSTKITENKNTEVNREITSTAMTCLGTPEFMAPELYEETYTEKVDIYAFGMTLLEMVTSLTPYHECTSAPQIYKKVTAGELPPELTRVKNENAKEFIKQCLQKQDLRPVAKELLDHMFLKPNEAEDFMVVSVLLKDDDVEETKEDEHLENAERDVEPRSESPVNDDENEQGVDITEGPQYQFRSNVPFSENYSLQPQREDESVANTEEGHIDESSHLSPLKISDDIESSMSFSNLNESKRSYSRLKLLRGSADMSSSGSYMVNQLSNDTLDEGVGNMYVDFSSKLVLEAGEHAVSVVALNDHTESDESILLLLRLKENLNVEFLFDLHNDDPHMIAEEMKSDNDISRLGIPSEIILEAIFPVVQLAKDVALRLKETQAGPTSLSEAVLNEVLLLSIYLNDTNQLMDRNSRFEAYRDMLIYFDGLLSGARSWQIPSSIRKIEEKGDGTNNVTENIILNFDDKDLVFQELLIKWREVFVRSEREHRKKIEGVDKEKIILKEQISKENERLFARRDDLVLQLLSMEVKFKERMHELDLKKSALEDLLGPVHGLPRSDKSDLSGIIDSNSLDNTGNNSHSSTPIDSHLSAHDSMESLDEDTIIDYSVHSSHIGLSTNHSSLK